MGSQGISKHDIDYVERDNSVPACEGLTHKQLEIHGCVINAVDSDAMLLNSLCAKFFRGNINMYLHFMSFLHTEMP